MISKSRIFKRFIVGVRLFITPVIFFILFSGNSFAQKDTTDIIKLFDRALDFGDAKIDSVKIVAGIIEDKSNELHYTNGHLFANRLKGIYAEYIGDYNNAISHYLWCLETARKNNLPLYEASALSDLAYLYTELKNPEKAKDYYIETAKISLQRGEVSSIVNDMVNLGAIFNQLGKPDSSLAYLKLAESAARGFGSEIDFTSIRNNMGNAFFQKKEWGKALYYFRSNLEVNKSKGDAEMLWYDVLNIADVFIEFKKYDSAKIFLDHSLEIAKQLKSQRKEADVYQLKAKYHQRRNEYREALNALQQWNYIDTSLVNAETRATMIQMEQRYHLKEKEHDNELLVAQVEAGRLRTRNITFIAIAIGILGLTSVLYWSLIRKKNQKLEEKNELIQEQNSRLAALNAEKNSLISVVSHDLNTPFSSIKMWVQLLEAEKDQLNETQVKAVERIKSSVDGGLNLIRNILDVERVQVDGSNLELEKFDIQPLLKTVIGDHEPAAKSKEIAIFFEGAMSSLVVLSDKQMLYRAFSNLLSNAIKFTPRGKNIHITVRDKGENVEVLFRDEGLGIAPEEMKYLFAKYSKISTKSTEGESSTGLGLSIVKRILSELNGTIRCLSELNVGTTFTVELKK
jgi:signal transduction histidine kinase